jgi:hypothetical protein
MDDCMVHLMQNEAFLGKTTISNQRLLAQSAQVLFAFRMHFIEAVKKMKKEEKQRKINCTEFKYNC